MDTLDYSGTGLNTGSKVVFAAYGDPIRKLDSFLPDAIRELNGIQECNMIMPGVAAIQTIPFVDEKSTLAAFESINSQLSSKTKECAGLPLLIWCDDAQFTAASIRNFLWVAFTRANPSHDIHGIDAFYQHKHWGCNGPVVLDARIKPHHAPPVELDPDMVKKTDRLFSSSGSLHGII
jgi:4-hydroxy-3-polyprenylbenzoate decarboxylase